jgi:hypothetical protein
MNSFRHSRNHRTMFGNWTAILARTHTHTLYRTFLSPNRIDLQVPSHRAVCHVMVRPLAHDGGPTISTTDILAAAISFNEFQEIEIFSD